MAALFWVVPVSGAVLVLATYGIGAGLVPALVGLVAAWFVATSPIVLFMLMPAISDVPGSRRLGRSILSSARDAGTTQAALVRRSRARSRS